MIAFANLFWRRALFKYIGNQMHRDSGSPKHGVSFMVRDPIQSHASPSQAHRVLESCFSSPKSTIARCGAGLFEERRKGTCQGAFCSTLPPTGPAGLAGRTTRAKIVPFIGCLVGAGFLSPARLIPQERQFVRGIVHQLQNRDSSTVARFEFVMQKNWAPTCIIRLQFSGHLASMQWIYASV